MNTRQKETGISWIGRIPESWGLCKLGTSFYMKGRIGWQGLNSDDFIDDGPYLVTGTDFRSGSVDWDLCYHISESRYREDSAIHVRNDDILFTKDGTVGKVAYISNAPDEVSLNSHLLLIRPTKEGISNRFLFWVLQSDVFDHYKEHVQHGTVMDSVSQSNMERFVMMLPPYDEQSLIADCLDTSIGTIDSAIGIIAKQLETLDGYRKSLIQEAVTKGLNPNAEMKSSGIDIVGAIPAHWSTSKLRHVCTRIFDGPFGSNLTGDDYSDEGVRVVRLENLKYLEFDDSKQSFVSEDKYRSISAHTVYPDDLILATFVEDDISVCKLPEYIGYAVNKSDCVGLRLKGAVSQDYLHYYLSSNSVWQFLRSQLHGATRGRVNTTQIKQIPVVLPPFNEQAAIVEHLNSRMVTIDRLIIGKRKQLETLRAQRQSLIYEYVTGKRRVV